MTVLIYSKGPVINRICFPRCASYPVAPCHEAPWGSEDTFLLQK